MEDNHSTDHGDPSFQDPYPISTVQDEADGEGWVKRTKPYGGPPRPTMTAGTGEGNIDNGQP